SIMTEPVMKHGGVTDKFIGDSIMAFWGPPFSEADAHAALCCRAALEQRALLDRLREQVADEIGDIVDPKEIDLFCGIATGEVVAGNVGPAHSQNYTVIGNAVNLAARLEAATKTLGTPILVSEETGRHAESEFRMRELAPLDLRGRSKPERVFELVGARSPLGPGRSAIAGPSSASRARCHGQVPRRNSCSHGAFAGKGTPSSR